MSEKITAFGRRDPRDTRRLGAIAKACGPVKGKARSRRAEGCELRQQTVALCACVLDLPVKGGVGLVNVSEDLTTQQRTLEALASDTSVASR